jgi:riboflavin synthase
MFTGIIHHQGVFKGYSQGKQGISIAASPSFPFPASGESVAVNGVCLTLIRREKNILFFNLSQETLARTNLGNLRPGDRLNLELPLTLESLLSGHLLTGHVDGQGRVIRVIARKPGKRLAISFPAELRPYLIPKGSIAVNGVSLTVTELKVSSFEVELIPLTLEKSNLTGLKPGHLVNLECDIFGKYVYNCFGFIRH